MVNDCHDVTFQLLKTALGNIDNVDYTSDQVDWRKVMSLTFRQGIAAVCFDAFCHLPKSVRPDDSLFLKWLGHTLLMEERYRQYEEAIITLSDMAHNLGLRMLVLKGYGCSLNYPQPKHRPCGDIDIFLMDENGNHSHDQQQHFEAYLEKSQGVMVNTLNAHHSQFRFGRFLVENHSTILDVDAHKSSLYLNDLLEGLAASAEPVIVGNAEVWLPSVKFNSIHLLRHMASDFASVRTNLRNVLDWSTFVETHEIDWSFVHEIAYKSNTHRFLDAINGICVHYLGYAADKFPIESQDDKLEHKVLNEILTCTDNPDHPQPECSFMEKVSYDFHKTRRMWKNRWKYQIVYDESILESFLWKAMIRLRMK